MTGAPSRQRWVGGGATHVVEVGDRTAPALVVAHGAGSSSRFVVEAFGAAVSGAGLRLVAPDLAGHGGTPPLRDAAAHTLDRHATDLARVAAEAGDVLAVGGVSLGAHAAARTLATRTVRARALVAVLPSWLGRGAIGTGPHAAIAAEVRRDGVAALVRRVGADASLPPWLRGVLSRDLGAQDPASLAAALLAVEGGDAPTEEELARVDVPTLVAWWADDPGHPSDVADAWARATGAGARVRLDRDAIEREGVASIGRRVVAALLALLGDDHAPGVGAG